MRKLIFVLFLVLALCAKKKKESDKSSGSRKDTKPRPATVTSKSSKIVYYAQGDPRWGNTMYSSRNDKTQTYRSSACGPTSMAMVVATLKDKNVIPPTMGKYALANGFRTANSGTAWGFFCKVAAKYSLKCTQTASTDAAVSALKSGKLVVASMKAGYWTRGGHYICLYDVKGDSIVAHDPASIARVKNTIASFKRESSQYWIISK